MSAVSILSYLRYLHDVNRKLLQRGGLRMFSTANP